MSGDAPHRGDGDVWLLLVALAVLGVSTLVVVTGLDGVPR